MKKLVLVLSILFCFLIANAQKQDKPLPLKYNKVENVNYQMLNYQQDYKPLDLKLNSISLGGSQNDDNIKVISTIGLVGAVTIESINYYTQPKNVRKDNAWAHYGFMGVCAAGWIAIQITF
ncbi:MAG: hypothetical protein M0R46_11740 [Candidatus Muirbacterium halophilum]|nr:hypothetical protein [Candidatus Muirbacterium halophilum]